MRKKNENESDKNSILKIKELKEKGVIDPNLLQSEKENGGDEKIPLNEVLQKYM